MKAKQILINAIFLLTVCRTWGQGTFIYDQQSANESLTGGAGPAIQNAQPIGQSFIPTLSSVGFIRLYMGDEISGNHLGATIHVNLMANSITGPVIGTSESVAMPDGFGVGANHGFPNFIFDTAVPVTPGTTYYFQPIVESGDLWGIVAYDYNYTGGTEFYQGNPRGGPYDLWFREGIIVPEPSTWVLLALGGGALLAFGRRR